MSNNYASVMVKYPQLSQVKTRLAKTIGDEKALEVYLLLLENVCNQCIPLDDLSYQLGCFITPIEKMAEFKKMYNKFSFYSPQKGKDLGARMRHAFDTLFENKKAEKALLIGADIPNLNSEIIENAFKVLSSHDIVVGPSDDGGYYLVGMKSVHICLFENIDWGSSTVLEETLQKCNKNSLSVAQLEVLSDLDREEDLKSFPEILKKMQ